MIELDLLIQMTRHREPRWEDEDHGTNDVATLRRMFDERLHRKSDETKLAAQTTGQ